MKKILVADDEKNMLMLFEDELSEAGFEVLTAQNGVETLKKFTAFSPDLLILDIKMPNLNGVEVLREIRRRDRNIPVLVTSAFGPMKADPEINILGIQAFFTKPVDITQVIGKAQDILNNGSPAGKD